MSVDDGELNGAPEVRREQMIRAALEVIQERGFPDTRIADVAERAGVSPALVIYYFGTKDSLLTEAMRFSEDAFYDLGARRMEAIASAKGRLEEIVAVDMPPDRRGRRGGLVDALARSLGPGRQASGRRSCTRCNSTSTGARRCAPSFAKVRPTGSSAIDADDFAVGFSALLDGLAIQIALQDPVVDGRRAFELSMRVAAAAELGFEWSPSDRSPPARKA